MFFITSSFAQYQEVKIGTIDQRYKDLLTHTQLISIIKDIENQFESQLGFNVFDYSENGKPIDILFIKDSQKKKKLKRYIRDLDSIKDKIKKLDQEISTEQSKSIENKNILKSELTTLNKSVTMLNKYIETTNNSSKLLTTGEYNRAKAYISQEQKIINKSRKLFNKNKSHFNLQLKSIKRKISRHNTLVRKHNNMNRRIEALSNSIQEVKGKAFGKNVTSIKTYYKNGEQQTEKSSYIEMQKIEIYSFEGDLNYLKVVLAHEIAHLVGVDHINESDALMNPLLQENQINQLDLKYSDIEGFQKAFDF